MARKPESASQDPPTDAINSPAAKAKRTSSAVDESHVEHVINKIFYNSPLFHFAKWVLLLSLGLVGAGSITIFGFNLDLASRMMTVREQVEKVNKDIKDAISAHSQKLDEEITKARTALSTKTGTVVDGLKGEGKTRLDEFVVKAQERLGDEEKRLKGELNQRQATLALNIKAEQDRIDTLSASIAAQDKRLNDLVARLDGLERNSTSILAIETKLSSGTSSGNLQLIGAVLESAAACLMLLLALALASAAISLYCLFKLRRIERRT